MKKQKGKASEPRYFSDYLKEREKDPGYKTELDRARLRVAIAREIKKARENANDPG